MKHLSLILNAVLIIAVAVLYYLHFSCKTSCTSPQSTTEVTATQDSLSDEIIDLPLVIDSSLRSLPIAYVNLDSLNAKYKFIEKLSKEIEKKAKAESIKLEKEMKTIEDEYNMFVENYKAGLYKSQKEISDREQYFARKQQELGMKEQNIAVQLEKERRQMNEKIMKNVSDYLKKYSNELNYSFILATGNGSSVLYAKDSLNITNPILQGLNSNFK